MNYNTRHITPCNYSFSMSWTQSPSLLHEAQRGHIQPLNFFLKSGLEVQPTARCATEPHMFDSSRLVQRLRGEDFGSSQSLSGPQTPPYTSVRPSVPQLMTQAQQICTRTTEKEKNQSAAELRELCMDECRKPRWTEATLWRGVDQTSSSDVRDRYTQTHLC